MKKNAKKSTKKVAVKNVNESANEAMVEQTVQTAPEAQVENQEEVLAAPVEEAPVVEQPESAPVDAAENEAPTEPAGEEKQEPEQPEEPLKLAVMKKACPEYMAGLLTITGKELSRADEDVKGAMEDGDGHPETLRELIETLGFRYTPVGKMTAVVTGAPQHFDALKTALAVVNKKIKVKAPY